MLAANGVDMEEQSAGLTTYTTLTVVKDAVAPPLRRNIIVASCVLCALLLLWACSAVRASIMSKGGEQKEQLEDASRSRLALGLNREQHIWVVRHGDKYSSYPDCPAQPLCFNQTLYGDNAPLTPCGLKQAGMLSSWLRSASESIGGVQHLLVSPYTRTLQTALPFAEASGLKLKVEYLLSEASQPAGPEQPFNNLVPKETVKQLEKIGDLWDLSYGSPPIPTPETAGQMYDSRVMKAAKVLNKRFPPASGNLVVVTHATTSFSIAYGFCHMSSGTAETLQSFVEGQAPIGPAGVVHVVRDASGTCTSIHQTDNSAYIQSHCGKTHTFKCMFDDYPDWYWEHPLGAGPGRCG